MSKLPGHALIVDFHAQSPEKAKRVLLLYLMLLFGTNANESLASRTAGSCH